MNLRLEKLKKKLKKDSLEDDEILGLCSVMEVCGGYQQLLELPLPALNGIMKYLEFQAKQNQEMGKKARRGKKK